MPIDPLAFANGHPVMKFPAPLAVPDRVLFAFCQWNLYEAFTVTLAVASEFPAVPLFVMARMTP